MSQAGSFLSTVLPPGTVVETLQGNTGGPVSPNGANNIFVQGDGTTVLVAGDAGTNTLTISAMGAVSDSFVTDSGTATPVANILNIKANTSTQHAGSSVSFSGSGNTVQFNVTDANANTIIGQNCGNNSITGISNTIIGSSSGMMITSAGSNVIIGTSAAGDLTSGSCHTLIGNFAGGALTGTENSDIYIGYSSGGLGGESNTLRIGGATGSALGQLNQAFIYGIKGANVGSVATVVTEANDQLGTAVITAGTGISITPGANTITIATTGTTTLTYTNVTTSPYVVLSTDDYLSVNSSGGPITLQFPNAANLGKTYVIKDRTGSAAANNITITTVGGVVNIDNATTFVMNTNFQAISLIGNSSSYEIY